MYSLSPAPFASGLTIVGSFPVGVILVEGEDSLGSSKIKSVNSFSEYNRLSLMSYICNSTLSSSLPKVFLITFD
jgi:hypothetical protein